jgi:hypothetical protein
MLTYTNTTRCGGPCFPAFVVRYFTMRWIPQCQNGISERIDVQPMHPPVCDKDVRFLSCRRCRFWTRFYSTLGGITVQYLSTRESTSILTRLRFGDERLPGWRLELRLSTKSQVTPISSHKEDPPGIAFL